MLRVDVITLFPDMFRAVTEQGVTSRALKAGLAAMECWNPRDYTVDTHRTVDDRPYGGGPGMVMMYAPLRDAIAAAQAAHEPRRPVIALSPQGRQLDQARVKELASSAGFILLAGRYEGIDQRVLDTLVDDEISIGDYVLSGGELPAMVVIDAVVRTLPGALGHEDSASQDSFEQGLLDYPHYTRPEVCEAGSVPAVLLSGDHAAIARWRMKQALGATWLRRPDLLANARLDKEQQTVLEEFKAEHGDRLDR
jgi:tRNA (guanine37-N1)-methyltransferase